MAMLLANDFNLHYRTDGGRDRPAIVLIHSLGTDLGMWQPQRDALAGSFFVVSYDARGHGHSSVPPGPYTIAQMGTDLLTLVDALHLSRFHVCGLSLGGMVGQWLAVHAAHRVDRLVLSNTAAKIGTADGWNARIAQVEADGLAAIESAVISRWFTEGFRSAEPAQVELAAATLRTSPVDGYAASCAAIRDMDQRADSALIARATLIIAGTEDQVTTLADANLLAGSIPDARLLQLHAAHLANIEAAGPFTTALLQFLHEGSSHGR